MGQPGKAIFSGVIEMIARTVFALGTLRILGFTTICWTHQAAWITAGLYVLSCSGQLSGRHLPDRQPRL